MPGSHQDLPGPHQDLTTPSQALPGLNRTSPEPHEALPGLTRPQQTSAGFTSLQQNLTRLHQDSKGPPQDLMRPHQCLTMPPQDLLSPQQHLTRPHENLIRLQQDLPRPPRASPGLPRAIRTLLPLQLSLLLPLTTVHSPLLQACVVHLHGGSVYPVPSARRLSLTLPTSSYESLRI